MSLDDFKFPFNEESIIYITKIADGNPRRIQDKCTTALIEGAQHNIRIIDRKFLQQIQNDLGKEFESIKDLLIQYPDMERNLAWLLEVRGKFKDTKSFEEALFNFSETQIHEINENMPLLNYFGNTIKNKPFSNKRFFVVLHFLKDLIPFMNGCENLGLKPSNTICFYKKYKYPNREEVSAYLEDKGYQIYPLELLDDFLSSYNKKEIDDEILIIEDGGYIAPALHKKFLTIRNHVIGCVEQTTKGIREDKNIQNLRFPIISLPSSKLKQEYEPSFVSDAVINNIHNLLPDINFKGQNALVVGGGTIGKEIASKLKSEMNVTVFDSNPSVLVGILPKRS